MSDLLDYIEHCIKQNKQIIKYSQYKEEETGRLDEECPICFGSYEDDDTLKVLLCPGKHTFHVKCIDKWLMRAYRCPKCNLELYTDPQAPPSAKS